MRKFLFVLPSLLACALALAAEQPAPSPIHPAAAAALALTFGKSPAKADPFSPANAHPQDCGCLEGLRCTCGQTCGCTKAPFQKDAVAKAPVKPPIADPRTPDTLRVCPSCGPSCGCTPEDNCGDPDCPAVVGKGLWTIKGGAKMPPGYRWNAVEGTAFYKGLPAKARSAPPVYVVPQPVFSLPSFGNCQT